MAIQTVVAFALLTAAAVGAFVFVDHVTNDQRQRVLEKRAGEVAILLTAALGEVRSALGVLRSLTSTADDGAFDEASASLLTGNVRAVGRADRTDGGFVVRAGRGDLVVGASVAKPLGDLFAGALDATDVVAAVVPAENGARLVFALVAKDAAQVVFRETAITPTQVATTIRGQAFDDLEATLYAAAAPERAALVLTTTDEPLSRGLTTPITVGAAQWLLVTAPRGQLNGSLNPAAKWVVLVFGLTVALAVSVLIETLARRRRYAFAMVDARTAELQEALDERSRLEEGQRRAREEAESANRAKSDFLSRMSHELRTPLNGVLGFAQLLAIEPLTERQLDSVRQIEKGGWHLLGLINEVLDLTRIETGAVALSPEPVLASEVLGESIDLVAPIAERRNIHLVAGSAPGCDAYVFADRQRVKQILLNLMSNAVKYNRPGGSVAVRCSGTATTLRMSVVDTGPGIAAEHLGLLFVPFERLGAEHSDVEGTGIGLALSRQLAEAMGGTLTVDTAVGEGSTFHLELPLVEGPVERLVRLGPTHLRDDEASAALPPTTKLLYIEDNLSNVRLVERVVERRPDIELVVAMQGRLGLELTRQHRPAMVLLDLHLPDIDGSEVLRQLREEPETQHIPVVVVSADATPGQVGRLLAAGAFAYLTKPLNVKEFLAVIDSVCLPPTAR